MAKRYAVPAIKRAFEIIEYLTKQASGAGISDLAKAFGYPLSSTATIIYTLHDLGYVERLEADSTYRLSVKLLGIGRRAQDQMDLVVQCHSLLEDAVRESGLTAHLAVLRDGESMYVDRVPAHRLVQINSYIGQRWPVTLSACGKAFLTFMPEAQVSRILKEIEITKNKSPNAASVSSLMKQLKNFRVLGYTWEKNEGEEGVACVAAPIFGPGREVMAAISLTGTTDRFSSAKIPSLGELARKYSELMSRRLGG